VQFSYMLKLMLLYRNDINETELEFFTNISLVIKIFQFFHTKVHTAFVQMQATVKHWRRTIAIGYTFTENYFVGFAFNES